MKFKSPVYSQASRSIAGITYSHNRGGMYTRSRATPTNPNTPFQQRVKEAMAVCSSHWVQVLTQAERDAWDQYALQVPIPDSLGELRNIGGIGHFNRTNVMRVQNGIAILDTAPTVFDLGTFSPIAIDSVSPTSTDFTFSNTDEWASLVGGRAFFLSSRPQNPGINFFKGPFRFAGLIEGALVPPTSPATIGNAFTLPTNTRGFFQFRVQQVDGRTSLPVILTDLSP